MIPSAVEVEHADWPTLKEYCTALGLNPRGRSAVVRQRVLDVVAAKAPETTWKAGVHEIAAFLSHVGHPDEAARLWESTLSLDAPAPWVGLGGAYLRAGELEKAAKAFDRAVAMGDPAAALHRAEVLAAGGNLDAAIEEVGRHLANRPDDFRGRASLVVFLSRAGRPEQVADALRRILEVRTDARAARSGLGWTLLRSARFGEAAVAYRESLDIAPQDALAWNNLGVALAKAGRLDEAGGALRRAVSLNPTFAEALNNLGCVELALGNVHGATAIAKAGRLLEHPRIAANAARAVRRRATQAKAGARRSPSRKTRPA